jgi:hypothetical protein
MNSRRIDSDVVDLIRNTAVDAMSLDTLPGPKTL